MEERKTTIFGMPYREWEEFKFVEGQLGIVDAKANNVLMVNSVLIVISTLTTLFQSQAAVVGRIIATVATVLILSSVGLCIRTIWVTWATELSFDQLVRLCNRKTRYLHGALVILVIALVIYTGVLFYGLL